MKRTTVSRMLSNASLDSKETLEWVEYDDFKTDAQLIIDLKTDIKQLEYLIEKLKEFKKR